MPWGGSRRSYVVCANPSCQGWAWESRGLSERTLCGTPYPGHQHSGRGAVRDSSTRSAGKGVSLQLSNDQALQLKKLLDSLSAGRIATGELECSGVFVDLP
eukprot:1102106-Alexandrium_andersonii.AAC.1